MIYFIYGLYDDDGMLRYIGKTTDPNGRSHLCDKRSPVGKWRGKLGHMPDMRILKISYDKQEASEIERSLVFAAKNSWPDKILNLRLTDRTVDYEDFKPENLRQILAEQGRDGQWLADQVGVTKGAVSLWLSGRRFPSEKSMKLIAHALNLRIRF